MKSSAPPPPSASSASASTSVTAVKQLVSSSSPPPPPSSLSLRSPELQAEFLRERRNKFQSPSDTSESSGVSSTTSPLSSPFSLTPSSSPSSSSCSSPSPGFDNRQARLSLSSPELLSELKESRNRSLRHVPAHKGMTTVFSGRGRGQTSGSTPPTTPANQRVSR
ncbi:flocculation protein FLO11-like [Archocentrus centrarchus]|uniref:flocculation protein FLO11-like n=1 Tax=Archocentrus centrarchus TaxID=63155 RepID=UPI0011E9ED17|nr:flocculation protein FLO11-like [Archocentrus centrarchus]